MRKAIGIVVVVGMLFGAAAAMAAPGSSSGSGSSGSGSSSGHHRHSSGISRHRSTVIDWSKAEGRPTLPTGPTAGFYIWHEGDEVFVASTAASAQGQKFSGSVTVDGAEITDPHGIKTDPKDGFKQAHANTIEFKFDTHEQLEGLRFHLKLTNDGTAPPPHSQRGHQPSTRELIKFKVRLDGNATGKTFYGPQATEAKGDPVTFNLQR